MLTENYSIATCDTSPSTCKSCFYDDVGAWSAEEGKGISFQAVSMLSRQR